ncbi:MULTISPECIES: hypothetical protein [unclassified Streptomyces]|nr:MULTISPECIES: hypothetical protein [unclassified Streptomyces]WRZ69709.1 hypothetical protein OG408_40015 [Streptomyces sp. NBC_01257]WSU64020.1 hypothetical protein OG450_00105 [Streptomyces sp. NBC_01104]
MGAETPGAKHFHAREGSGQAVLPKVVVFVQLSESDGSVTAVKPP